MKTTAKVIVAIAVAAVQWCVTAATIEVETVVGLTNAVARANAGEKIGGEAIDTIVLKAGPYTFPDDVYMADNTLSPSSASYCKIRINVTVPGLTIKGENDSSRATWTHGSEPVVIDGNGGKAIQLQLNANESARIENITFANCNGGADSGDSKSGNWCNGGAIGIGKMDGKWKGGDNVIITNCVFRGNQACLGGAIGSANHYFVYDCFFTNNLSTRDNGAGCMFNGAAYGCEMVGNMQRVAKNTSMYGCNIHGNGSTKGHLFTGSASYSNCTFRSNTARQSIVDGADSIRDCIFEDNTNTYDNANTIMFSCVSAVGSTFRRNHVKNGYLMGTSFTSLYGCVFEENSSFQGVCLGGVYLNADGVSAIVDHCVFASNSATNTSSCSGAALRLMRDDSHDCRMVVTNCTFVGNYASGSGGAIYAENARTGEAAWDGVTVFCSAFTNNVASDAGGIYGAKAIGCTFSGNSKANTDADYHFGNAAVKSCLVECDLNDGELVECAIDRCRIHDVPATVHYLFRGWTRCTNSIVESCSLYDNDGALLGTRAPAAVNVLDADFVNCTFVTNKMHTFKAYSGVTTKGASFVNCLFYGNSYKRANSDLSAYDSATADLLGSVSFASSYYSHFVGRSDCLSDERFASLTNSPNSLMLCENPRFAAEPKWSLSLKSPLLGLGDASIWSDGDMDLAGNLRLRDGKVDVGCYECWLHERGMRLIFR